MREIILRNDVDPRDKATADKVFGKMFDSMQLLAFTVLYYDFDFDTEDLIEFNSWIKASNTHCLDDFDNYIKAEETIKKYSDFDVQNRVKEFPYRARLKICGMPKLRKATGIENVNLLNIQSLNAIDSYMVLSLSQLIEKKKWRKTEVESFWGNLKRNASETYARGMKDEFVVEFFKDQLNLTLGKDE